MTKARKGKTNAGEIQILMLLSCLFLSSSHCFVTSQSGWREARKGAVARLRHAPPPPVLVFFLPSHMYTEMKAAKGDMQEGYGRPRFVLAPLAPPPFLPPFPTSLLAMIIAPLLLERYPSSSHMHVMMKKDDGHDLEIACLLLLSSLSDDAPTTTYSYYRAYVFPLIGASAPPAIIRDERNNDGKERPHNTRDRPKQQTIERASKTKKN